MSRGRNQPKASTPDHHSEVVNEIVDGIRNADAEFDAGYQSPDESLNGSSLSPDEALSFQKRRAAGRGDEPCPGCPENPDVFRLIGEHYATCWDMACGHAGRQMFHLLVSVWHGSSGQPDDVRLQQLDQVAQVLWDGVPRLRGIVEGQHQRVRAEAQSEIDDRTARLQPV